LLVWFRQTYKHSRADDLLTLLYDMPLNTPTTTPSAAVLERFQAVRWCLGPTPGRGRRAELTSRDRFCSSAMSPQELERNNDEVLYRLALMAANAKDADAIYRGIIKVLLARNQALPFVLRLVDDDLQATGTAARVTAENP